MKNYNKIRKKYFMEYIYDNGNGHTHSNLTLTRCGKLRCLDIEDARQGVRNIQKLNSDASVVITSIFEL